MAAGCLDCLFRDVESGFLLFEFMHDQTKMDYETLICGLNYRSG